MNKALFVLSFLLSASLFSQDTTFFINQLASSQLMDLGESNGRWGDYDNDGDPDVLLTGYKNNVPYTRLYRNDGADIFTEIQTGLLALDWSEGVWGDFDNDNDLDILLTGATIINDTVHPHAFLYENTGNDIFQETGFVLPGVYRGSSAFADLDNDGDLDLLITGSYEQDGQGMIIQSRIVFMQNNGADGFQEIPSYIHGIFDSEVDLGDCDNDQDIDMLLTGYYFDELSVGVRYTKLFRNHGNFSFLKVETGFPDLQYGNVAWGDYDNDGDLDVLLNGDPDTPSHLAYIFENDGNNNFFDIGIEIIGTIRGSVAWADYDNDGDLDFSMTGTKNIGGTELVSKIFRNNNTLFSEDYSAYLPGTSKSCLDWGDYDGDGDLDILLSGNKDYCRVWQYLSQYRLENPWPR